MNIKATYKRPNNKKIPPRPGCKCNIKLRFSGDITDNDDLSILSNFKLLEFNGHHILPGRRTRIILKPGETPKCFRNKNSLIQVLNRNTATNLSRETFLNKTTFITDQARNALKDYETTKDTIEGTHRDNLSKACARAIRTASSFELIPSKLATLKNDETWYRKRLSVDGRELDDFIVFVSDDDLDMLAKTQTLFLDSTFRIVKFTKLYKQCCVLSCKPIAVDSEGNEKSMAYPICFIFMQKKCTESYAKPFEYIKALTGSMQVKKIHCDFEIAQATTAAKVFKPDDQITDTDIIFCVTHYKRSMVSNSDDLSLRRTWGYVNSPERKWFTRILTLCHIDVSRWRRVVLELLDEYEAKLVEDDQFYRAKIQSFLKYYKQTYLGTTDENGRFKPPRYCPSKWSTKVPYERRARQREYGGTNNTSETLNKGLNACIEGKSSTVASPVAAVRSFKEKKLGEYLNLHERKRCPETARKQMVTYILQLKVIYEHDCDVDSFVSNSTKEERVEKITTMLDEIKCERERAKEICKNVATYDEWVKSHLEKHEKDIYFFRDVFPLSKRIDPHLEVFEDQLNALADAAWNNPENSFIVRDDQVRSYEDVEDYSDNEIDENEEHDENDRSNISASSLPDRSSEFQY